MFSGKVLSLQNKIIQNEKNDEKSNPFSNKEKKGFILSFGDNNINYELKQQKINDLDESIYENMNEYFDSSPINHIESRLQNHNFNFNRNNISYLDSQLSTSQEEFMFMDTEIKHYLEMNEKLARSNASLLAKKENLLKELNEICKKEENTNKFNKFNPFKKKEQNNSNINNEKKNLLSKIKDLEADLVECKNKHSHIEKEHLNEMANLKAFLKPNKFSITSTNDQKNELSQLNDKLELVMIENHKINHSISQIISEISFLRNSNPILKEKHDFYQRNIKLISQEYKNLENTLTEQISIAENHLKRLKEDDEEKNYLKIDSFENLINNSSLNAPPEKKIEFYENENKKIEEEIEKWKIQFWNLEKKTNKKLNFNDDCNYQEIDLMEISSKEMKKPIESQQIEFFNKENLDNCEILPKKNIENSHQFKKTLLVTQEKTIKSSQGQIKIAQSERKIDPSKKNKEQLILCKPNNNLYNMERKIYKYGFYSNSLGSSSQNKACVLEFQSKSKKYNLVDKTLNYTEKSLLKMRKYLFFTKIFLNSDLNKIILCSRKF